MVAQNCVLFLSLLLCVVMSVLATDEDFPIIGGSSNLAEQDLLELHPKLAHSFVKLGEKHTEFDLVIEKILSGTVQTVAGSRYLLNIQAKNKKQETKMCEADVWEKLWENFFQVKLTCQDKHYTIETELRDSKITEIIPPVILKPVTTVINPPKPSQQPKPLD